MTDRIFVHVPFTMLEERLHIIEENLMQPEIYFSGDALDNLDERLLEKTKETLESTKLRCTVHSPFLDLPMGSPDTLVAKAVMERYRTLTPVLERLKPVCVVVHTGYDRWRYNGELKRWLERAREVLKTLREIFPEETTIAIENVFDDSPDVLWMLTEGMDGVGVCFDIGHFHLFSKSPLEEWLERLGDRIVELHLHNNDGLEDRHWEIARGSAPLWRLIEWARHRKTILAFTIEAHTEPEALASYNLLKGMLSVEAP